MCCLDVSFLRVSLASCVYFAEKPTRTRKAVWVFLDLCLGTGISAPESFDLASQGASASLAGCNQRI